MICEVCGRIDGHLKSCPECYEEIKPNHYCSICKEGIQIGEEYIENDDGEYAHWECLDGKFSLADWLGYKIKIMEK